jgi:uncharacterized membrane protein
LSTASAPGGQPDKRRAPRWLWVVLILSLALNLLVIGIVAGSWWRHGGPRDHRDRIFTGAIERLMKDLPEAKRQHARDLLERHRQAVSPIRGELREARKNAKEAVLTEPYDEAKVKAALARFREIRLSQHQSMHDMMLGLLKDLTLKERKQLLDHIREGFRKRWRGKRPGGDRP